MTTTAQLRKAALAMPETEEGTHFGMVAFAVRGKNFAAVTDDGIVQLQCADDDAEAAIAEHDAADRLVRMGTPIGVRIPLGDIDGQKLNALVRAAWFHRAPKRLAASLHAAENITDSELPKAMGRPARTALHGQGITTLAQAAEWSSADLLALHGVGPKAVRILTETLEERGLSLP